jgi:hypothetical protein
LPALICLLARYPGGVHLRKLAPLPVLLHNGETATNTDLADGDRLTIGAVDVTLHIHSEAFAAPSNQTAPASEPRAADNPALAAEQQRWEQRRTQLEQEVRALLEAREEAQTALQDVEASAHSAKAAEVAWLSEQLEDERRTFAQSQQRARDEIEQREAQLAQARSELQQREAQLAQGQSELDAKSREYQSDLVRLHRREGQFEEREQALKQLERELEERWAELKRTGAELEDQLAQLDEWRVNLNAEAEQIAAQKKVQDELASQMTQRAASFEGQQAALASLRSRLERQREQLREEQQQLDTERAARETETADWSQKWQQLQELRLELETERKVHAEERAQWAERSATLESAVRQLRQAQEQLDREEQRVHGQAQELEGRLQACAEQEGILQGRLAQLAEAQERLEVERQALRERNLAVVQGEQAREALQEQLRCRAEELAVQEARLVDQTRDDQQRRAAFEEHCLALHNQQQEAHEQLEALRLELDQRMQALAQQESQLANAEQRYREQSEDLTQARRALSEERLQSQEEQQRALERQAQVRAEFEDVARQAQELQGQLPDLELRSAAALERLGQARAQLREHLSEVHQYVRGCQDDAERWRQRLRADLDKVLDHEQAFGRRQEEHRLAMAGFRQQLIDWQAEIVEMKRALARDETRLVRRQARVAEQARAVEDTSQRLAQQAEALEEQQRAVVDRRQEIDGHLGDMRDWYRQKLRDLAGIPLVDEGAEPIILKADLPVAPAPAEGDEAEPPLIPTQRSILTMGPLDPGDQRLADLLRELQLSDADTLTALLAEARRQRRSLRQVLLAGGVVTLYQLALIEAGNLTGLMLGPVRVIDRIRATPHETIYRVFDPRRGSEAVLRHLAEAVLEDALRPDEYRQRFAQAILPEPHLAATLEILEIQGRPAVLQEWLTGLPATDWPPLAAAPGVCYRLLTQAALGLAAAHRAGLAHGRLRDSAVLLTGDGILKLCGLGEPGWLHHQTDDEPSPEADLKALGRLVSGWCTPSGVRRGAKAKPLPEALVSILYRLAADGDAAYRNASELLAELERAGSDIPANAEAWDRLLRYVREHGTPEVALRQTA